MISKKPIMQIDQTQVKRDVMKQEKRVMKGWSWLYSNSISHCYTASQVWLSPCIIHHNVKQMPTLTAAPTTRMSSTQIFSALLINLTIWFGICTVGAAGNFQDLLKEGRNLDFYRLWLSWVDNHVPLILMSSILFITLRNCLSIINSAQKIARLYVGLALCFYPLHMFYNAASRTLRQSEELNWYNWVQSLATYDHFTWFLEFAWFTGTFAVVTAICIWHQDQERAATLQKAETANLNLHLALEQQRLRSITQQLEPHFIFNALNAISALVRSNENQ